MQHLQVYWDIKYNILSVSINNPVGFRLFYTPLTKLLAR